MNHKIFFSIILAIAFFALSCNKNDDDNNPGYDPGEKTINSFEIDDIFLNGIIDQQNMTVTLKAPAKVNISNLTPKIKISEGASIQPGSLVPVDFSSDVTYTVTAENGTTQNYTVSAILLTDTAFVIIDMQNGAFENPDFPILNKAEITTNIKQLAERVRDAGKHVVYSQATSANLIEGSYEWQPVPGLGFHDGDVVVLKTSSNAFQGSDLHKELAEINIGSIIICGVATDMCINNSFGGALDRRYDIIMMADGHSTMGDTYEVIIEQYNQTWQSKGAGVKNGDEIVF